MRPGDFRIGLCAQACALVVAGALCAQAQNRVVSWNFDSYSTVYPWDVAGLVPVANWVDTWLNDTRVNLPDHTGTPTGLCISNYGPTAYAWSIYRYHPGYDADGTANKEMLNGYLNAGMAAWNPPITNSYFTLTNIPFPVYDIVVYLSSDVAGRPGYVTDGTTTYYFSTMGAASVSGANAVFKPATATNSTGRTTANFAFFPGLTGGSKTIKCQMEVPEQWGGIAAFQVIECSNVYVLYGPVPTNQTVPVGQPASFSVIAGGLNPLYQWRRNGIPVPGATNATFTIVSTAPGQDGTYDVVVSNDYGAVTSQVATLAFYTPKRLRWAGTGPVWDTTTANWRTDGGTQTTYTETDHVLFDPLGASHSYVTLADSFSPSSVTVSNATYTLAMGGLLGPGSLKLTGNGTLVMDTTDARTGPTEIDAGCILQVGAGGTSGSLGTGPLTNNGALVIYKADDLGYGLPIYGTGTITNLCSSGTVTFGGDLYASWLAQAGGGVLLLQGSNTFTGGLVIHSGTVWARSENSLGRAQIILNGGELQLIYGFNYPPASLVLAGGLLHGGVGGSQTFGGPVTLAADSQINVDGGNTLTLTDPTGINGSGFVLSKGGSGTLILAGTNNTWAALNISAGTVQIGNGGMTGSLGAGPIQLDGNLVFNCAGTLLVTNPISGSGTLVHQGGGITALSADNAAAGFGGTLVVSNGTLRVNGTSGPGAVSVAGGALGGTGTVGGSVSVAPAGTLAPGEALGTLTIMGDLNLAGNLIVEINKSLTPSNDMLVVIGAAINTGTGTVTIQNLGPALLPGDTFKLFNKPLIGGETLSVVGSGVTWTNRLAIDGTVQVLAVAPAARPVITTARVQGANLTLTGTNGTPGATFYVLSTTNLALPVSSWEREAVGQFPGDNSTWTITLSNSVSPATGQKFYLLQLP